MLLLTSFTTWENHHRSNASDDLLVTVSDRDPIPGELHYCRQLPVDFDAAPIQVINAIEQLKPDGVVLCGMAERRTHLTVESNGCSHHNPDQVLYTSVPLADLIANCSQTDICHDAGNFVCSHTYYEVLHYLGQTIHCIFVHVPPLTPTRHAGIVEDFIQVLQQMH